MLAVRLCMVRVLVMIVWCDLNELLFGVKNREANGVKRENLKRDTSGGGSASPQRHVIFSEGQSQTMWSCRGKLLSCPLFFYIHTYIYI